MWSTNCRATAHVARTWRVPHPTAGTPNRSDDAQASDVAQASPEPVRTEASEPVPASVSSSRRTSTEDFLFPDESAFPWWPVPSHVKPAQQSEAIGVYHSNVRLADGRVGLLVDPGSYGNLVGAHWLQEAGLAAGQTPALTRRDMPLQVGGVGKGAQVCQDDCRLPIALTRSDGSVTTGSFTSPVVQHSACPALLGLRSLQENRAILDLEKKQLHFVGPGEPTLVLPPGSETFQLESAMSGHLLLPCTSSAPATSGEHHLFADKTQQPEPLETQGQEDHTLSSVSEAACRQACNDFHLGTALSLLSRIAHEIHARTSSQELQPPEPRPWLTHLLQKVFKQEPADDSARPAWSHSTVTTSPQSVANIPGHSELTGASNTSDASLRSPQVSAIIPERSRPAGVTACADGNGLPAQVSEHVQVPQESGSGPQRLGAHEVCRPSRQNHRPGLATLRRVLLISSFHSTASAFLSQGWEATRLRPLELLRSGFDDAVGRIKQNEYQALWVDLADARQFAGQERTSSVCSRLSVLVSWAGRQEVSVVFAASRHGAWQHPAVKALLEQGRYHSSYHNWCRVGA